MSEAAVIENEAEVKPEVVEKPKPSRADYDRIQQEKASKSGWKDYDDYVEEGGDPEKWKTADAFNTYGELIGTVKRKEREFDERIQGVQMLAEARIKAEREKLAQEREILIDEGGKASEVKAIEKQMDALNVQQQQRPQIDQTLAEWNANNAWIDEKTPKAVYARSVWNDLLSQNLPVSQALEKLEADIRKHYPPPSKQTNVPDSEKGRTSAGFGKQAKVLTMSDLTSEESYIYKHNASMWKDQKDFLQSVADTRKAAGGK